MKKLVFFSIVLLGVSFLTQAQSLSWFGNTKFYVGADPAAAASWEDISAFNSKDFGSVTALYIGVEAETYESFPGGSGVTVTFHYNIDNGSFQAVTIPYLEESNNNNKWQLPAGIDMAAGLAAGDHTIEIYLDATDGTNTLYEDNGGFKYNATFNVPVPVHATLKVTAPAGTAGVWISGTFNNWDPAFVQMTSEGNNVFSYAVTSATSALGYKYFYA
ncbi:MAG: hypothetical protein LBD45_04690, partial [Bacteroidales bacterium]|nr:hypothetical protein [Bacteroidales bacterium]